MAATEGDLDPLPAAATWRTPMVIVVCGCLIGMLTFGPRSAFGFFMQPMSLELSWGRDVFGLALAIQNLLWGIGQPIAGAIADRFGSLRVISAGAVMYAAGLFIMRYAATPMTLDISAGVLIGFGLAGCSFNLVLSAFGKLLPPEWRGVALGAGTAAGSFGQFVFAPFGVAPARQFRLAIGADRVCLFDAAGGAAVAGAGNAGIGARRGKGDRTADVQTCARRSFRASLLRAAGARLLYLRISTRLHYRASSGLSGRSWPAGSDRRLGDATIGLFNIVGSLSVGWLQSRLPKRYILSAIYFVRALAIVAFISFPISTFSALVFGGVTGLAWLSSVPPTSSLVALMFGTRWLATLYGFAFFSHQVGGFLGVLLGGIVFEKFGSYIPIWWLSVLFGVLSALINLPIVEAPVVRPVARPA
jgi:MFS family permease